MAAGGELGVLGGGAVVLPATFGWLGATGDGGGPTVPGLVLAAGVIAPGSLAGDAVGGPELATCGGGAGAGPGSVAGPVAGATWVRAGAGDVAGPGGGLASAALCSARR